MFQDPGSPERGIRVHPLWMLLQWLQSEVPVGRKDVLSPHFDIYLGARPPVRSRALYNGAISFDDNANSCDIFDRNDG